MLNTVTTFGIGLMLISLKFPYIIDVSNKAYHEEVVSLAVSTGFIVMSTITWRDIKVLKDMLPVKKYQTAHS